MVQIWNGIVRAGKCGLIADIQEMNIFQVADSACCLACYLTYDVRQFIGYPLGEALKLESITHPPSHAIMSLSRCSALYGCELC